MEAFFAKLPPTQVALEARGGSHHWGRRLAAIGHTVQLIPPQYVKPFVRRGKNDRNDAEAISEAAARPEMPSVAVRSAEQQAEVVVLSGEHQEVWGVASERAEECSTAELLVVSSSKHPTFLDAPPTVRFRAGGPSDPSRAGAASLLHQSGHITTPAGQSDPGSSIGTPRRCCRAWWAAPLDGHPA